MQCRNNALPCVVVLVSSCIDAAVNLCTFHQIQAWNPHLVHNAYKDELLNK